MSGFIQWIQQPIFIDLAIVLSLIGILVSLFLDVEDGDQEFFFDDVAHYLFGVYTIVNGVLTWLVIDVYWLAGLSAIINTLIYFCFYRRWIHSFTRYVLIVLLQLTVAGVMTVYLT